jgi:hypothetical protein
LGEGTLPGSEQQQAEPSDALHLWSPLCVF